MADITKDVQIPDELYEVCVSLFKTNLPHKTVTIKLFKAKDNWTVQKEALKVKSSNGINFSADIDSTLLQTATLLRGIVNAPWKVNDINELGELPQPLIEWVRQEFDDFNTISVKKKEN